MNTFAVGRFLTRYAHAFDMLGFQLQRLAAHGLQNPAAGTGQGSHKTVSVTLNPMEFWQCEAVPGQRIESRDGIIWITQTGDIGDHIVESGGSWTAQRQGRVVVQAMTQAALRIEQL